MPRPRRGRRRQYGLAAMAHHAKAPPPPPRWSDASNITEVRAEVRRLALEGGVECPCCGQRAQVYRRTIHATMARDLVRCWRASGGWGRAFYLPDVLRHPGDFAKLRYWGLIGEVDARREDGGRAGWWIITQAGLAFINGALSVPKYALLYDGKLMRLEGRNVSIADCLGSRFDLAKLLAGEA